MNRRQEIERAEQQLLAPYAAKAAESRGRRYPAREHPLRTAFQRDRDRIVHATAFRRLEQKTQVFLPHEGDHYRTRLTHTIEVAQIARTMARNLALNEDLTEAIALVHDLGHTPFGHAGEDVLNELLAEHGGFNHNAQSLRVVDILEQRYPEHPGLNLTYEVREGIAKHETKVKLHHPDFDPAERPTLEASLVDIADELAYNAHDVDDGLRSGLIALEDLRPLSIWTGDADTPGPFERAEFNHLADDQKCYALVRYLVNREVTDVLYETARRLESHGITDLDSLRRCVDPLCGYSASTGRQVAELKQFLRERLYHHPDLLARAEQAHEVVATLYRRLLEKPSLMPPRFQEMLLTEDTEIVVADYIAGMTDRYAEQKYKQLR